MNKEFQAKYEVFVSKHYQLYFLYNSTCVSVYKIYGFVIQNNSMKLGYVTYKFIPIVLVPYNSSIHSLSDIVSLNSTDFYETITEPLQYIPIGINLIGLHFTAPHTLISLENLSLFYELLAKIPSFEKDLLLLSFFHLKSSEITFYAHFYLNKSNSLQIIKKINVYNSIDFEHFLKSSLFRFNINFNFSLYLSLNKIYAELISEIDDLCLKFLDKRLTTFHLVSEFNEDFILSSNFNSKDQILKKILPLSSDFLLQLDNTLEQSDNVGLVNTKDFYVCLVSLTFSIWFAENINLHNANFLFRDRIHFILQSLNKKLKKQSPQLLNAINFYNITLLHPHLSYLPIYIIYPSTNDNTFITSSLTDIFLQPLNSNFNVPTNKILTKLKFNIFYSYLPNFRFLSNIHLEYNNELEDHFSIAKTIIGSYNYYYYCCDGINDIGWGCAYRSLQTIYSWYIYQGYPSKFHAYPNHNDIQTILVNIGDKENSFIGSKSWIGSIEIGLVLNYTFGIRYNIIHLKTAHEISDYSRQLLHHFKTVSSPLMLGCSNKAYTILGIAYDEVLGNCKLLILDPHYTGIPDTNKIIKGGYCNWRDLNFLGKSRFCNIICPQMDINN